MPCNPTRPYDHRLPFLQHLAAVREDPKTEGRTLGHVAKLYDYLAPLMTLGMDRRYQRQILRSLELSGTERILDVGCGTGTLTRLMADALTDKSHSIVLGIDAASAMIAVARRKAKHIPNIAFETVLAEDLPFPNESFDRAVSTMFFHHINFDLKRKTLAEIWRTLADGGRAVIVDIVPPTHAFGSLCAWSGYWLFNQPEIRENIEGQLEAALRASPFHRWRQVDQYAGYIGLFELTK